MSGLTVSGCREGEQRNTEQKPAAHPAFVPTAMRKKWHLVVARAIVTEPKGTLKINSML